MLQTQTFEGISTPTFIALRLTEVIPNIRSFVGFTLNKLEIKQRILVGKSVQTVFFLFIKRTIKKVLFSNTILNPSNETHQIYTWKSEDDYTIISGIKTNSYFSFYSALFLHGLTLQIPKTFYLNYERSEPTTTISDNTISQEAIDTAFNKPQRKSNYMYKFYNKKIIITNGKFTNRLGVQRIQILHKENKKCYCTDLERTLIDVSVRPVYSGGVFEVLEAYRQAKGKVDVLRIKKYLNELNYTYPYEQIIGFYLEKAQYEKDDVEIFNIEKPFDFYLTYGMRNKVYSEKWKLYYPKGM